MPKERRKNRRCRLQVVDLDHEEEDRLCRSVDQAREEIESLVGEPDVWQARVLTDSSPARVLLYYFGPENEVYDFDRRKPKAPSSEELIYNSPS
jgi:hypothetical protein